MTGAVEPAVAQTSTLEKGRVADEWRAARLLLKEAVAALGAIGIVIYGVVRLAADSAYAQLLTTPDQVGVSQSELLGRAGLYVAVFVVFGIALSTVWILTAYFLL